eukprot:m51a1_g2731 putative dual specificity tyrosine-phosphorylation-regulated kinase (600) ;mRNA; f:883937-886548
MAEESERRAAAADRAISHSRTPLFKLTVNILGTYRHINDVYFKAREAVKAAPAAAAASQGAGSGRPANEAAATSSAQAPDGQEPYDDKNADYIVRVGEVYGARYEARALLGRGSFGQVVRAWDRVDKEEVAIKIIKNKLPFYKQACIEVQLLRHLNRNDPNDSHKIVRMKEYFKHMNHLCIVFEMMSYNLYELLNITQFNGISLPLVRKFAQQILTALAFLSSSHVNVIHCDLKPENILLKNPKRSAIKIIDFGSSCLSGETMYKYIQSRYYRSPEILLGLPYSFPIDMWSLGCILVEMHVGDPLFNGRNEVDQIMKIAGLLGLPPKHMIDASAKVRKLFMKGPDGNYQFVQTLQEKMSFRSLGEVIGVETFGPKGRRRGEPGHSAQDYRKFKDLVERMLVYDPSRRITPLAALAHPFFRPEDQPIAVPPGLSLHGPSAPGEPAASQTTTVAPSSLSSSSLSDDKHSRKSSEDAQQPQQQQQQQQKQLLPQQQPAACTPRQGTGSGGPAPGQAAIVASQTVFSPSPVVPRHAVLIQQAQAQGQAQSDLQAHHHHHHHGGTRPADSGGAGGVSAAQASASVQASTASTDLRRSGDRRLSF